MKSAMSFDKVLEYIEENLYEDICLDQLASAAGYSKYHFLRLFKKTFDMTPLEYVRRRRITESARDLADTDELISQIGYKHGFNSKENFTRAFQSEHHICPSEYRMTDNSLKLLHRNKPEQDALTLVPTITVLEPFSATVFQSDEEEPARFWNKYNCGGFSKRLSGGTAQMDYGFSVWNFEQGKLDYYAGILTEYAKGNVSGTIQLNVNGGLYAVFDTPKADKYTFVNTIRRTWDYIMHEWIPQSAYEYLGDCDFETYRECSREFTEQIFIHIRKRKEG
ncbi:MAG: AraC family transcriptional regulator [Lachnospiraceae bacterium]|nr:AraC family transcriptional regulator [Lachnospiraceae bacterium]